MRTDAATNQRQLLDSAAQLLSEQGPQVSLRTIAKHAGVGVATLYRHFPTRESLEEALVLNIMTQVTDAARWFRGGPATPKRWRELAEHLGGLRIGALADHFADEVRRLHHPGATHAGTPGGRVRFGPRTRRRTHPRRRPGSALRHGDRRHLPPATGPGRRYGSRPDRMAHGDLPGRTRAALSGGEDALLS